jgi:hypothetical protein
VTSHLHRHGLFPAIGGFCPILGEFASPIPENKAQLVLLMVSMKACLLILDLEDGKNRRKASQRDPEDHDSPRRASFISPLLQGVQPEAQL